MNYIIGFFMSLGMFTIIPCPYKGWKEEARGHMLVCFPLIGAIIGGLWYGVVLISSVIPVYLRTVLVAVIPWLLTGFMHLDGFMDVCDAVMSRRDLETRQKILKDSRVGAFAVICIGILMLTQAGSVLTYFTKENMKEPLAFLFIPIASRIAAAFAVMNMKPMNTSQYVALTKKTQFHIILILMLLGLLCVFFLSIRIGISVCSVILVYLICALYGKKMLGGMNGDISGYALTIGELAGLITLIIW